MKTKLTTLIIAIAFLGCYLNTNAQNSSLTISEEAKLGYLARVETNKESGNTSMIYILPSSPGKVKYEIYSYDKALSLINTVKQEEDLVVMKNKWQWLAFEGNSVTKPGVDVRMGGSGADLAVRKRETTYNFDFQAGKYIPQTFEWQKNKYVAKEKVGQFEGLKDGEDFWFFLGGYYEVKADNVMLAIGGKVKSKNYINAKKNWDVVGIKSDGSYNVLSTIEFTFPQKLIYASPLTDEEGGTVSDNYPHDFILVFAPDGSFKKERDPKPTNYTYVRTNSKGKVLEKVAFESPSNGWRISGAIEKNGSVYLYGAAITKEIESAYVEKLYNNEARVPLSSLSSEYKWQVLSIGDMSLMNDVMMGSSKTEVEEKLNKLKYTHLVIGKFTNQALEFISATPIANLESKQAKPPGQKKHLEFDGNSMIVTDLVVTKNGNMFITALDIEEDKFGRPLYNGVNIIQFDLKGNLIKNYGIEIPNQENDKNYTFEYNKKKNIYDNDNTRINAKSFPSKTFIVESEDGQTIKLLIQAPKQCLLRGHHIPELDPKGILNDPRGSVRSGTGFYLPKYEFDIATINSSSGEISDLSTIQKFPHDNDEAEKVLAPIIDIANVSKIGNNLCLYIKYSEVTLGKLTMYTENNKVILTTIDLSK